MPMDKPSIALEMMRRFLDDRSFNDKPLPDDGERPVLRCSRCSLYSFSMAVVFLLFLSTSQNNSC
jgi:hypothetical protein